MELDPILLSRIQFAFVVSYHAIFPAFTIGLASYIVVLEALHFRTGNPQWDTLAKFWTRIFAVVFAMGVVSGIVMAFQFGTNWSEFSYATANVLGPLLSYEVLTAFFLEATFLGVLLFGRDRVSSGTHLFAAVMVAVGTLISTFWILSANSWLHTPTGFELRGDIFHVISWREVIFNPSFPYRFTHMTLASFLTGGFVVAGVSAWFLLRGRAVEENRRALSMTLWLLAILAPVQIVVGDLHGLNTLEHEPIKIAAMEGNWERQDYAPLTLVGFPDAEAQENHYALEIPGLASLILTHHWSGVVPGITQVPPAERPPVAIVFWAFRIMVGLGVLMLGFAWFSLWLRWRGRLFSAPRFLRGLTWMIPAPFVAMIAGWFVTEIGRAPWLVHGLMSHAEGVTPSLTGGMALTTLIGYILVYAVVFPSGVYYILRIIRHGLEPDAQPSENQRHHQPMRPVSAAGGPQ